MISHAIRLPVSHQQFHLLPQTSTTQTWATIFHVSLYFTITADPLTDILSQMPPMRNRTPHNPPLEPAAPVN